MKMTDFADVEWDADATTTTDMMIQSLFHPPLARKKVIFASILKKFIIFVYI